jgi:hypothetical protein
MEKKQKHLCLALAVVFVLALGYWGARSYVLAHPYGGDSHFAPRPDLANFGDDKIARLENLSEGFTLEKKGDVWEITKGQAGPQEKLNQEAVAEKTLLLNHVYPEELVVKDPSPADLAEYGLDKPSARVRITGGDKSVTFSFGRQNPGKTARYVLTSERPGVYLLENYNARDLVFSLKEVTVTGR